MRECRFRAWLSIEKLLTSSGFSARQRKDEVERLNEQLRKINISLRQQARSGTIYAPGLTYAPSPTFTRSNGGGVMVVEPETVQTVSQVGHLLA